MSFKRFEDIIAWQKAQKLTILIYHEFNKSKDFGFKDQICRASVSISNNIAEGYARASKAEFKRFLWYAISSNAELKSMLYLTEELGYLSTAKRNDYLRQSTEVARLIYGLIKSME